MKYIKHFFIGHFDFILFFLILIIINFPLFIGGNTNYFAFYFMGTGHWWQILTFVFAHLTVFHFFIDVIPFLVLYFFLDEKNILWRMVYFLIIWMANILAVLFFHPVNITSIRGLSGITYGFIVITALELVFNRRDKIIRTAGIFSFLFMLWLVSYEMITRKFPFQFLLLGRVGIPVFVCHLAGVISAVFIFSARQIIGQNNSGFIQKS
ncbi:MAG: rhomboid family intramembrane serine protease [Actinobacteria bacterium]|nr:rhomboid family intramembrane serine protease [Actinomycetota bacterium]MCL5674932.1 rhomboid family intramembrane serine protease [Candidatus Omnitrophota bacterium]